MALIKGDIGQKVMYAILFVVLLMYLFGQFTIGWGETFEFVRPDVSNVTFTMVKIILVMAMGFAVMYFTGLISSPNMSRKQFMTLIVISAAAVGLYYYVVQPLLGAADWNSIAWKTGQFVGILP